MTNRQTVTPGVIEKERVDISLSGGVNARDRLEFVDWTKYWTTLENLVNDDDNCYVKRSGVTNIAGTTTDDYGQSYISMYRALKAPRGAAAFIGANFKYYKIPSSGVPYRSGLVPELAIAESYPVGSNPYGSSALLTPSNSDATGPILATQIGSKYAVTMWTINDGNISVYDHVISIVDRATQSCVRTYKLSDCVASYPSHYPAYGTLVLVADRYIHVYYTDVTAGNNIGKFFQIDTNSLPADLTGVTPTTLAVTATSGTRTMSAIGYSTGSAVISQVPVSNKTNIEKFGTGGTSLGNADVATYLGNDVATDGTTLYITGYVPGGSNFVSTKKVTISSLAVAATVTESSISFITGSDQRIGVDGSGNMYWVRSNSSSTVTGGVSAWFEEVYSLSSGGSASGLVCTIPSWMHVSSPFYDSTTGSFYIVASHKKQSVNGAVLTYNQLGYAAVLELARTSSNAPWGSAGAVVRPVVMLDEYTARNTSVVGVNNGYHVGSYSTRYAVGVETKATSTSRGYTVVEVERYRPDLCSPAEDGATSGGMTTFFDGYENGETGIFGAPSVYLADSGSAGGPGAGTYNYFAVFEYVDASGKSHFSQSSDVSSIAMAGGNKINVQVTWNAVTSRIRPYAVACKIYRTKVGQTQYYLAATALTRASSTSCFMTTQVDAMSDATLGSQPQPYRQPGTAGTALDRNCPPASQHAVRHKDRLWVSRGTNLYYSSFLVDGEAYWFNAQFSIPVYGGTGRIIAIASMDGQLVVFKKDAVFLIDGDGPPENGGTGAEFSPPRRIMTEFGCIDPRSVVATPDGIVYRSYRGVEILTRSGQIVWIGEKVQDTVNSYPYTGGACFDRNRGRVLIAMHSAESSTGVANTSQPGVVVCLDMKSESWSVFKYGDQNAVQDIAFAQYPTTGTLSVPFRIMILKGSSGVLWDTYGAQKYDLTSTYVPFKMETGWIKVGMQERIKVTDLFLLAKKITNHALTISVAYDYSPTYEFSRTFQPNEINSLAIEQLNLNVPRPDCQSIRFKIEDSAPSDTTTYPISTGDGCEIMGVTVNIGKRGGGPKLPVTQGA